ncbi:MAG: alpha-mannosidase [Firmicutes bacterium]|nr:alpha-mannosidase [Bacillota bacterium]
MFLTDKKLERRIRELRGYRYRDSRPLAPLHWRVGEERNLRPVTVGERWAGRDLYAVLTASVAVPAAWAGRRAVLRLRLGGTGGGNNSGFEGLVRLNGMAYQAVDQNHEEVWLPPDAAGQTWALEVTLWSGLEGGGPPRVREHQIQQADLAWLHETTDDLYYTARAVWETAQALGTEDYRGVHLLRLLDDAFRQIDWRAPGSAAFDASLAAARAHLAEGLARFGEAPAGRATVVGHSHIDLAWLWRLRHTREKAVRSWSTQLRLMDEFPEYRFVQSQPQLYEWLKTDEPALYERLKAAVARGQWEPEGGMWVEADTNLPSGEALVRQLLFGQRFFQQEFGRRSTVLWLPDAFGYSAALPQLMRQAGLTTFITTKLSWNQYNRMPHDTFWWRGLDGSTVLAHLITTPSPEDWQRDDRWFTTYNGLLTAGTVLGSWRRYRDRGLNDDVLIAYGYGDGGGGVTRDMLEMRRRLARLPGLPAVEPGSVAEWAKRLHHQLAAATTPAATWDGELYLEYHRGTYTSQGAVKAANRRLELALREAEWLAAWAWQRDPDRWAAAQAQLNGAWKILLRNQFHDILPGSSIREVYEDHAAEFATANATVAAVAEAAESALTRPAANTWTVLNSAPWARAGVVRLPDAPAGGGWVTADGTPVPAQRLDGAVWLAVPAVPGLGATAVRWTATAEARPADAPFEWDPAARRLTTPYYEAAWNAAGQLVRLFDRRARREILPAGAAANVFEVFEDKPLNFDAWDIDLFYQEKRWVIDDLVACEWLGSGPVMAALRFEWHYPGAVIRQCVRWYAADPRIDFDTTIEWHTHHQLLKVAFPVQVRAREAHYQIQFGHLARPTHWNTPWDQARFEVVGHQWVDLSEWGYGVALANDSKYGYDVKDQVLRLTLLKSATHPDPDADQGTHRVTYALYPHAGEAMAGGVEAAAWNLNQPLTVVAQAEAAAERLVWVTGERVQVSAVKRAEDAHALVVRLYEYAGGRTQVTLHTARPVARWQRVNLLEDPVGEVQTGPCVLDLGPFEIQTVRLEWAD